MSVSQRVALGESGKGGSFCAQGQEQSGGIARLFLFLWRRGREQRGAAWRRAERTERAERAGTHAGGSVLARVLEVARERAERLVAAARWSELEAEQAEQVEARSRS